MHEGRGSICHTRPHTTASFANNCWAILFSRSTTVGHVWRGSCCDSKEGTCFQTLLFHQWLRMANYWIKLCEEEEGSSALLLHRSSVNMCCSHACLNQFWKWRAGEVSCSNLLSQSTPSSSPFFCLPAQLYSRRSATGRCLDRRSRRRHCGDNSLTLVLKSEPDS